MKLTVIMPVYNSQKYCRRAIESILRQTYRDFEFIIVDDASSDETPQVIASFKDRRIRLLHNRVRQGVAKSLNIALKRAQGKYIARMDADDVSISTRLTKQNTFFFENTDVGVLGTAVELINEHGESIGREVFPSDHQALVRHLAYTNPLRHSTVMFRKSLTDRWGGYDETLDGAEDYDLWLRLARKTNIATLGEVLVKYRLSKSGVSYSESRRIEQAFFRAKIKAVTRYRYPLWHLVFALKSLFSALIPVALKQQIYTRFFKY